MEKSEEIEEFDLGQELINAGFNGISVEELNEETILDKSTFIKLFNITDEEEREKILAKVRNKARDLRVTTSFNKMLKKNHQEYIQSLKRQSSNKPIKFDELKIEALSPADWKVDYFGVYKYKIVNFEQVKVLACPHPILPVERLINIDTNIEKVKLAFYKDNKWNYVIVERELCANKSKIVKLANRGIEVTSETAKDLVNYISEIVALNIDKIPYSESITHLGWINDKEFAPYSDLYKYDGESSYKNLYESVTTYGDYDTWKKHVRELRKNSIPLRFIIASSFASVLVKIFKLNPFMVHLWGKSGNGKTVSQMVCASIWGNPSKGKLLSSLDNTKVALERMLNFLRNMPLIADELQLIKNIYSNYDTLIYILTEGKGKDRGTVDNGLTDTTEWDNIIITSGEEPITGQNSKEGVKNRVFEIEENNVIIENGNKTVNMISNNYGFAGKEFVKIVQKTGDLFERYNTKIEQLKNITESKKQINAMACILIADEIVSEQIFNDSKLELDEIKDIFTKDVDEADRYIELILDIANQNINKFYFENNRPIAEVWGKVEIIDNVLEKSRYFCFIPQQLYKILKENNINWSGIKKKMADKGYVMKNLKTGEYTLNTKIDKMQQRIIKIKDINYDYNLF